MSRRHPLPTKIYALVEHTPATVLLEGGKPDNAKSCEEPWTRLFTAPLRVCAPRTAAEIPGLFATIESAVAAGQCAAGFFTYECGNCFEPKAGMRPPRLDLPLAWFGIYERSYAFDHQAGAFVGGEPPGLARFRSDALTAATGFLPGHDSNRADDAAKSMRALQATEKFLTEGGGGFNPRIRPAESAAPLGPEGNPSGDQSSVSQFSAASLAPEPELAAEFDLSEAEYSRRIASIHEWIRAGDVYQLNFTAPLRTKDPSNAADLYARLRARQPVDYGAFLHWQPGRHILSFSPELFFRVDREGATRRIVTRPMKGTAPRGRTTREDRAISEWLRNDPKNRSENVMIVDLLRNDLGRVAQFGSVRAEELFAVERYSTLWQMTSTVTGELRPEVSFHDIFRALFPCGSITGAPKVRAMQLLAQLEDEPRGVYTGAIGFFSPRQTVFNVVIRTLELEGNCRRMGVGSGIVIDSDPAEEFRECLLKAQFLTGPAHSAKDALIVSRADELFLIETMLWNGSYPLLELHLERLADSAEYFGFTCDRAAISAALAQQFSDASPRKVRLLLDAYGRFQIGAEPLALNHLDGPHQPRHPERVRTRQRTNESKDLHLTRPNSSAAHIGRVCISPHRTDPADPMLYHKTTHRQLYARSFEQAVRDGFDDVLFLNLRGELTEGAISNVFVEKDGRWFTPPIECGLLAGVYRRHLLETRPEIEERILYIDDLRSADAVYLTNAVRGLRRVEIIW